MIITEMLIAVMWSW